MVLIIGAGLSGLVTAYRLKQQGIPLKFWNQDLALVDVYLQLLEQITVPQKWVRLGLILLTFI